MMLVQQLVQPPEPSSGPPVPQSTRPPRQLPTSTTFPKPQRSSPIRQPSPHTRSQEESTKSTTTTSSPKSNPFFTLRPATLADAPSIAHLGASTFSATFGFSMPSVDLKAYLSEAYSVSAISKDISDPTKHWVVAVAPAGPSEGSGMTHDTCSNPSDTLIGFAHLSLTTPDPCLSHLNQISTSPLSSLSQTPSSPSHQSSSLIELQRLYVSPHYHSLGIGKTLLTHITTLALSLNYTYLWLGVWEGNFNAQRVYEKAGFERAGEHEFVMGRCVQTDWIMVKEL